MLVDGVNLVAKDGGGFGLKSARDGISVRDYFAAKAMQGLISNTVTFDDGYLFGSMTKDAYKIADAMIKARDVQ